VDIEPDGNLLNLANQQEFLWDREAPFNVNVQYRAYLTSDGPGVTVASTFGTDLTNLLSIDVAWLRDPLDNNQAAHYLVQERWLNRRNTKQRTFFHALGRDNPIPFRGDAGGERFNVSFLCLNQTQFDNLELLLNRDTPLLFQTARKQWYVELETDYQVQQGLWDELHNTMITHIVICSFVEVDAP
jgi:hypothetical protein